VVSTFRRGGDSGQQGKKYGRHADRTRSFAIIFRKGGSVAKDLPRQNQFTGRLVRKTLQGRVKKHPPLGSTVHSRYAALRKSAAYQKVKRQTVREMRSATAASFMIGEEIDPQGPSSQESHP